MNNEEILFKDQLILYTNLHFSTLKQIFFFSLSCMKIFILRCVNREQLMYIFILKYIIFL